MKRQILFVLFLFFSFIQFKANCTEIHGGIKGFDGETIKAVSYEDYFSFQKKTLSECVIADGKFTLSFQEKHTRQIVLQIGTKSTSIYVDPKGFYNIGLEYNLSKNEGRAFNQILDLYFIAPEPSPLNAAIKDFNEDYKNFMSSNYQLFAIQKADKKIEDFIVKQGKRIDNAPSIFLKNYYRYALANLKDISGAPNKEMFSEYIDNQEILYHHKEFMNFWSQFYKHDFDELTLSKKGLNLMKALNYDNDVSKAIHEIKMAKGFSLDQQAELYLMQGLFEVYHLERIRPDLIIDLLHHLEKNSEFNEHKLIAKNMISNLKRNSPNRQLESFNLVDLDGKMKPIDYFFDQAIYLNFWSAKSIPSLRQMRVIKGLNSKYGEKIHFISISIDDQKTFVEACQQFEFDWNLFYSQNKSELIESFDLRSLPSYFLIDKGGRIIQAHTKGPAEIEEQLYRISKGL